MRRTLTGLLFLAACAAVLGVVYVTSFRAALDQLRRTGTVQLDQAADRLLGQLAPFQQLPNILSRHPVVTGLLTGSETQDQANEFLANTALTLGADAIFVLNRDGVVIAASNYEDRQSALGSAYGKTPYVERALAGSLGLQHGLDPITGQRDFFLARGVIRDTAPPIGVVVVRVDVDQLEFEWEGDTAVLTFLDQAGVVFVTNRIELPLARDASFAGTADLQRRYGQTPLGDFPSYRISKGVLGELWRFAPGGLFPTRALVLSQYMPRLNMTARIYLNPAPAAATAQVITLLAAALLALVAAMLWALGQRRRRLTDRLAAEAAANAKLEARVEERTQQLRSAQDQLVQAGKLTALGQMSAGISHELNQPLAAIRNFAENAVKLIDRDRADDARGNLDQIVTQSERITRIIRNLRGFARNEPEPAVPVDVTRVVSEVLRLSQARARNEGIDLQGRLPETPVMVLGGQVRLQQVLLNLVSNAMDAVADAPIRRVVIDVDPGDPVQMRVADSGPGITDPARVFEPFYTTKDVGASKGMGLGLSISYGIVGSFGGELSCENTPDGARFTVSLRPAP